MTETISGLGDSDRFLARVRRPGPLRTVVSAMLGIAAAVLLLLTPLEASAHEPIFGIGPRVIWKDGIGFQVAYRRAQAGFARVAALDYEILYGISSSLGVTVVVPQFLDKAAAASSNSGFGDVGLRAKWRFFRKDVPGGVYHAAVIGGLELPTGERRNFPALGSGTWDQLIGLTAGYEGRRWLAFGSARHKFNGTTDGLDIGDVTLLDVAVGFRPVKTGYLEPDVVVMLELNHESQGRWRRAGSVLPSTGGEELFLSAGVWLTIRNHAFKPGVQIPIASSLNGAQQGSDWRFVVAYEFHLGSLFGR